MVNDEELFKAEEAAASTIVNAFQELVDRQNKLAERIYQLEQEISQIKNMGEGR